MFFPDQEIAVLVLLQIINIVKTTPVALRDGTTELSTEESSGEEEYMCIHCGTKYDTEKEEDESNVCILVAKL